MPAPLQAADGPPPWPRTRDDVRDATQKSVVERSARRLASSEAAPAVLAGSQNGLHATDGPPPWPRTRDDVRDATQKSVVERSARRLASSESMPGPLQPKPSGWSPRTGGRLKSKKNIGEPEACTVLRVWQTLNMNLSYSLIHRTRIVVIR